MQTIGWGKDVFSGWWGSCARRWRPLRPRPTRAATPSRPRRCREIITRLWRRNRTSATPRCGRQPTSLSHTHPRARGVCTSLDREEAPSFEKAISNLRMARFPPVRPHQTTLLSQAAAGTAALDAERRVPERPKPRPQSPNQQTPGRESRSTYSLVPPRRRAPADSRRSRRGSRRTRQLKEPTSRRRSRRPCARFPGARATLNVGPPVETRLSRAYVSREGETRLETLGGKFRLHRRRHASEARDHCVLLSGAQRLELVRLRARRAAPAPR